MDVYILAAVEDSATKMLRRNWAAHWEKSAIAPTAAQEQTFKHFALVPLGDIAPALLKDERGDQLRPPKRRPPFQTVSRITRPCSLQRQSRM